LLVNPTNPPGKADIQNVLAAARTIKRTLHSLEGTTERDLEAAFASFARLNVGALIVEGDPFFDGN